MTIAMLPQAVEALERAFDPVAAVIIGIFLLPVIGVLFRMYTKEKDAKEAIMEKRLTEMREILEISNESSEIARTLLEMTREDRAPRDAFRKKVEDHVTKTEIHQADVQRKLDAIAARIAAP